MALTILAVPASTALTTLERVQAELGLTDFSATPVLAGMIQRASSAIAREIGRSYNGWPLLGVGQYQETLAGSGSPLLGLSCVPILSVTQVLRDEEILPPWSLTNDLADSYRIEDAEAGALYNPAGWGQSLTIMAWGWNAYSSRYILPGGASQLRYTVTYTAGYDLPDYNGPEDPTAGLVFDPAIPPTIPTVPPVLNTPATPTDAPPLPGAIEEACLVTVKAWWFSRAQDISMLQQRSEEQQISYNLTARDRALPVEALGLLRNYRRVV